MLQCLFRLFLCQALRKTSKRQPAKIVNGGLTFVLVDHVELLSAQSASEKHLAQVQPSGHGYNHGAPSPSTSVIFSRRLNKKLETPVSVG
jgi:hypothetical protein